MNWFRRRKRYTYDDLVRDYTVKPVEVDRDMSGAFAIEDNHPLWLAIHQVINEAEKECIEGARKYVANTNMCINSVGAGEGVALVRTKLIQKRKTALNQIHGPDKSFLQFSQRKQ